MQINPGRLTTPMRFFPQFLSVVFHLSNSFSVFPFLIPYTNATFIVSIKGFCLHAVLGRSL
ncbi:hypothetical protein BDZ91DRAFT_710182 [Kalaharituber pfeilii]|nr:hypothetical protein BDZ91DRAFT_710182 [Kalaharituber pfeilii]